MWSIEPAIIKGHIKYQILILLCGCCFLLTSCSENSLFYKKSPQAVRPASKKDTAAESATVPFHHVLTANYAAADTLTAGFRKKSKGSSGILLAASFVNINHLKESSPLGRLISEQIASRMAQNGLRLLEMKLRQNSIYIKEGKGEFLLSREIKEISKSHNSDFVLVGTYTLAEKSIFISARIVNTADNVIITACDYELARDYQVESLL